jgi:hypothetical protein
MLVCSFAFPVSADEPSEAAQSVIDMILSLNENTKPETLTAVRAAYDALSDEDKAAVWNADDILKFEKTYADSLNAAIAAIKPLEIDLFNGEKTVNDLLARYNVLGEEAKTFVTEYPKLAELNAKLDSMREWSELRRVNVLKSTMDGFSKYDLDYIYSLADKPSLGIYYYFEEVGLVERGDPSTGYYDITPFNEKVNVYKYAKIEMDIKFTDIDFNTSWPSFRTLVDNNENNVWAGYDFVNEIWFTSDITSWSQGKFVNHRETAPGHVDLGVWHHWVMIWDHETITFEMDGEKVFEASYGGDYSFFIIYPWACDLEMTNVYFTDGAGKTELSPFRNAHNFDNWIRSSNDEGATLLDVVEQSVADARDKYNALSDEEKALVTAADEIDRVQAMIDLVRSGKYPLTVVGGSADKTEVGFNEKVTVTADAAPEGKVFDKWTVDPELTLLAEVDPEEVPADLTASTLTFAMPDVILTLTATYKDRPPFTPGDVNDDGKVNAKDVTAIMKFLVGAAPKTFVEDAADYDSNGKVNAKDVTKLMKDLVTAK